MGLGEKCKKKKKKIFHLQINKSTHTFTLCILKKITSVVTLLHCLWFCVYPYIQWSFTGDCYVNWKVLRVEFDSGRAEHYYYFNSRGKWNIPFFFGERQFHLNFIAILTLSCSFNVLLETIKAPIFRMFYET